MLTMLRAVADASDPPRVTDMAPDEAAATFER